MCAYKSGCEPVVRFSVEKMTRSLVKDVVRKHETTKSS
jgi:hypothetical protein